MLVGARFTPPFVYKGLVKSYPLIRAWHMVGASRNTTLGLLSAAKIHSSAVTPCSHNRRPCFNTIRW